MEIQQFRAAISDLARESLWSFSTYTGPTPYYLYGETTNPTSSSSRAGWVTMKQQKQSCSKSIVTDGRTITSGRTSCRIPGSTNLDRIRTSQRAWTKQTVASMRIVTISERCSNNRNGRCKFRRLAPGIENLFRFSLRYSATTGPRINATFLLHLGGAINATICESCQQTNQADINESQARTQTMRVPRG